VTTPRFAAALNAQIGNEFAAHLQYVAVAVHFDALTMPRMAAFFYQQAREERDHAMMMVRYLLDTDTFTHYLRNHPAVLRAVCDRAFADLSLTVITAEELWDGWAAVIRKARTPGQFGAAYSRLTDTLNELRQWPVIPFAEPAVRRYTDLRKQKLNVGANDLRIAAIALEIGAIVVTRNVRDFGRVSGVRFENWVTDPAG
jgi:tRNA(fMet)-specific endonuclease VapC